MKQKKVMLLGDIGVGKSSIARRLIFDRFETDYKTTIGVDLFSYDVPRDEEGTDTELRLSLWDTDGDFGQSIFQTVYVRGASGAVVVADVTRPLSIDKMEQLTMAFLQAFPGRSVVTVINKSDLATTEILVELRKRFADLGDGFFVTSALNGSGILDAFRAISQTILRRNL